VTGWVLKDNPFLCWIKADYRSFNFMQPIGVEVAHENLDLRVVGRYHHGLPFLFLKKGIEG